MNLNLKNSVFRGWNESLSGVYSWSFRALSAYEKTIGLCVWTEAIQWSVTTHWRATKGYSFKGILIFFISEVTCSVFSDGVVSFLFALRCIFHGLRMCVLWERYCLSVTATATKGGRVLQTLNWEQTVIVVILVVVLFWQNAFLVM